MKASTIAFAMLAMFAACRPGATEQPAPDDPCLVRFAELRWPAGTEHREPRTLGDSVVNVAHIRGTTVRVTTNADGRVRRVTANDRDVGAALSLATVDSLLPARVRESPGVRPAMHTGDCVSTVAWERRCMRVTTRHWQCLGSSPSTVAMEWRVAAR